MHSKAEELKDHYPKNGCKKIALEIAEKLLESGGASEIITFEKNVNNQRLPFFPVKYPAIRWFRHYVCRYNNFAYDPSLGEKPIVWDSYSQTMFAENVPFEISKPAHVVRAQIQILLSSIQPQINSTIVNMLLQSYGKDLVKKAYPEFKTDVDLIK